MLRYLRFLILAAANTQKGFDSNQVCPTDPVDSVTKEALLETWCSGTPFPAANKPPIRIGILGHGPDKGRAVPVSCFSDGKKCKAEVDAWISHRKNPEIAARYNEMKLEIQTEMETWEDEFNAKVVKAIEQTEITLQQAQTLRQFHAEQLFYLKEVYVTHKIMMDYNLGNCGEQVAFSAVHLLEDARKFNIPLRIQVVNLKNSKFSNEHAFLLIDSNAPNIIIKNDAPKTAECLRNITKSASPGTICDLYNKKVGPFGPDDSNMYNEAGGWDSMKIYKLEANVSLIKTFPIPLQEVIFNELAEMNLEKEVTKSHRP